MTIFRKMFRPLFDADPGAGGGGGGAGTVVLPDWVKSAGFSEDTLKSEDFVKEMTSKNYKNPDEFYKGHRNALEIAGKKGLIVPTDKSTPDEVNKFWTDLGRPGKPEEYKLALPEKMHPAIKVTPESQKAFFEFAHKNGFSNAQAQELNNWYLNDISQKLFTADKAREENRLKADTELKTEWGKDYDLKMQQAQRAWDVFSKLPGPDGKPADVLDAESFNDPNVKRVFQLIGSKISEDTFKAMTVQAGAGDPNVQAQINAIMSDPKHPYNIADHQDHNKAVQEMLELNRKASATTVIK